MDETKYVAVPVEPTQEMMRVGRLGACDGMHASYKAMLAAAPTTHVAVKRELLRKWEEWADVLGHRALRDELRALLSQKGE